MKTKLFKIAWRNIWRNTRRTVITLITMVLCVGTMVWMITLGDGVHEQMIRSFLTLGLGSIQVHAESYQEDKAIEKAILDPEPVVREARTLPGVMGVSTRLNAFGLISHGNASQGGAIIGVEPSGELSISNLDEKIKTGNWLPDAIENERELPIVIGSGLAVKLGVDIGDRVFLTIQRFTGDVGYAVYFVEGIYTTGMGEMDKSVAYVPIDTLRDVMAVDVPRFQNAVHEITILLEPREDVEEALVLLNSQIGSLDSMNEDGGDIQHLEILGWEQIQPGLKQMIDLDNLSMYIMMAFVFVIVAVGIMNTFLMSVFERIREFGILMSLGTRPVSIFNLVMMESAVVGVIGAFAGLIAGLIAFWWNLHHPWSYEAYSQMSDIMSFDWSMKLYPTLIWINVMKAVVGIFLLTMAAALWPAIKASLLKPVEALRHV